MPQLSYQLQDRREAGVPTPEEEDLGLFTGELTKLRVELTADFSTNGRGDICVTGFIDGTQEATVVFAGRRARRFGPLRSHMRALELHHRRMLRAKDKSADDVTIELKDVRQTTFIEGCWRARFEQDKFGFAHRTYQFLAAQWAVPEEGGTYKTFGMPPAS